MAAEIIKKLRLIFAAILFLLINTAVTVNVVQYGNAENDDCVCQPVKKIFNESITDKVDSQCPKCYYFQYELHKQQDWASSVCIQKLSAANPSPLFVVVRQTLNVMSFQVPVTFPGVSPYLDVCKTLCPLANYKEGMNQSIAQNITIEISTSSIEKMEFSLMLSNISDFIITDDAPLTVNITPTKPRVMQYNMERNVRSVRIEAMSKDDSCMILAIQAIQCPIYDSVEAFEPQGYHQTLTRQSGISITKNTFQGGRQYVVLLLKPTDEGCVEGDKEIVPQNRQKEVTVSIIPSITDVEYYEAVFGAIGFYLLIYLFSFIICLFIRVRRRNSTETRKIDIENPSIQNYGTSDSESERSNTTHSLQELPETLSHSPVSFDETDIDRLPDIEHDKNIVRTKTIVFVSDLSKKKDKYLSERSKVYSWNLLTIAIFYGLPVIQLVYVNQRIVNSTGNQDLCYYNFLCSHQVGVFSDFNHIFSNIGYAMLGILFLLLVWRREAMDLPYEKENEKTPVAELKGIPRHYGLMYAMGWALVMEGVLSASYHVCPSRANFQFDTAFMYVIATVCMLKLYQSRHADIIAKSHTTWMVLAIVIIIGFGGVIKGDIFVWVLYTFAHIAVMFVVSAKIYYMGRWKLDRWIFKRIRQSIKLDIASRSIRPIYLDRFIMLTIAILVNVSLDIFGVVRRPPNFGAFLLSVFIANLLMYLIYYSLMKIKFKERIRWIPIMYMGFSFVCWGAALFFFLAKNTSWQVTPAESREKNKHCIILNFFDHHDVWHFLSSCALFFSFMVLFTLDDDLEGTPRSKIIVF